jgi:hypothetical protein
MRSDLKKKEEERAEGPTVNLQKQRSPDQCDPGFMKNLQ